MNAAPTIARAWLTTAPSPHAWEWLDGEGRVTRRGAVTVRLRKQVGAGISTLLVDVADLEGLGDVLPEGFTPPVLPVADFADTQSGLQRTVKRLAEHVADACAFPLLESRDAN